MARRGFAAVDVTRRFDRSFQKLSADRQGQCADALEQLLLETIPNGLHYKPIRPANIFYEVRINSGDRLVIYPVSGNIARVMDVIKHDDIEKWGK